MKNPSRIHLIPSRIYGQQIADLHGDGCMGLGLGLAPARLPGSIQVGVTYWSDELYRLLCALLQLQSVWDIPAERSSSSITTAILENGCSSPICIIQIRSWGRDLVIWEGIWERETPGCRQIRQKSAQPLYNFLRHTTLILQTFSSQTYIMIPYLATYNSLVHFIDSINRYLNRIFSNRHVRTLNNYWLYYIVHLWQNEYNTTTYPSNVFTSKQVMDDDKLQGKKTKIRRKNKII